MPPLRGSRVFADTSRSRRSVSAPNPAPEGRIQEPGPTCGRPGARATWATLPGWQRSWQSRRWASERPVWLPGDVAGREFARLPRLGGVAHGRACGASAWGADGESRGHVATCPLGRGQSHLARDGAETGLPTSYDPPVQRIEALTRQHFSEEAPPMQHAYQATKADLGSDGPALARAPASFRSGPSANSPRATTIGCASSLTFFEERSGCPARNSP
jgi:hypothetical protein